MKQVSAWFTSLTTIQTYSLFSIAHQQPLPFNKTYSSSIPGIDVHRRLASVRYPLQAQRQAAHSQPIMSSRAGSVSGCTPTPRRTGRPRTSPLQTSASPPPSARMHAPLQPIRSALPGLPNMSGAALRRRAAALTKPGPDLLAGCTVALKAAHEARRPQVAHRQE